MSAVYNVERYLTEFIDSIEAQTFDLEQVQVVVVDDGSTDASLARLNLWARQHPERVIVLSQANGGQGSARNRGIRHASGEWVTFVDPDDVLDPEYLSAVDAFITRYHDVDMIATNRVFLEELTGETRDAHPLRSMFGNGDRLIDIAEEPEYFHGAVNSAFFRRAEVERQRLRFDLNVRPNFEDGHFCCHYLLDRKSASVGFLASAVYLYRRRADKSSTVQTALTDPDRFVKAPRFGHLDVLKRGAELHGGRPPLWLQNFVLYELSFYFAQDRRMTASPTAAHGEVADKFVATLAEIAQYLDPAAVEAFDVQPFDAAWREILLHSFSGNDWVTPYAALVRRDPRRGEVQVGYRFAGARPAESISVDGEPFTPSHEKVWVHQYWEHDLLHERLAWVPDGDLTVEVNGTPLEIREGWPRPEKRLGGEWKTPESTAARIILRISRSRPVRHRFRDAWVLLDRRRSGDDNAERLFRHLRDVRPEINAWFTIEKDTADWHRLRADGYGKRVVPYGSLAWRLLLLNARHVISSQIDNPSVAPWEITRYGPVPWQTTFLQHGVIKDDLSRWLNRKSIDLFVTSTPGEHHSIVDDDTPYAFTSREVRMLGLARFDRLLELGNAVPTGDRDTILVCPTWRHWLAPTKSPDGHDLAADLADSEWVRNWLGFLRDERLRSLAERDDLDIVFLPHPILQPALPRLHLPSHVRAIRSDGQDVQAVMARSVAFVTDYSSMAFNAAYIDRPVVYFQFDAERVMRGGHTGRHGYYDYDRDGFGPVATSLDEIVAALRAVLEAGREPDVEYRRRIDETFPIRDGRCCERTVQAILELDSARAESA